MTRTPYHSKKKKSAVHGLPLTQAAVGGFFIIRYVLVALDSMLAAYYEGKQIALSNTYSALSIYHAVISTSPKAAARLCITAKVEK